MKLVLSILLIMTSVALYFSSQNPPLPQATFEKTYTPPKKTNCKELDWWGSKHMLYRCQDTDGAVCYLLFRKWTSSISCIPAKELE